MYPLILEALKVNKLPQNLNLKQTWYKTKRNIPKQIIPWNLNLTQN